MLLKVGGLGGGLGLSVCADEAGCSSLDVDPALLVLEPALYFLPSLSVVRSHHLKAQLPSSCVEYQLDRLLNDKEARYA